MNSMEVPVDAEACFREPYEAVYVYLLRFVRRRAPGLSEDEIALRVAIATTWPRLSAAHQEAIELAVLDGLMAPEAGHVLGISGDVILDKPTPVTDN